MKGPITIAGKIAVAIGTGRGRLICLTAVLLMLLSAVAHANPWYVLSAAVFGASMWMLCLATVRELHFPRRYSSAYSRVLDRLALPGFIVGAYVPFSILAVKGERVWAALALLGAMALLWVVLDALVVFRRRLITSILHLVGAWTAIAMCGDLLASASHVVITAVLGIGLLISVGVVATAVASIPREWKSWRHAYPLAVAAWMSLLESDIIERGGGLL